MMHLPRKGLALVLFASLTFIVPAFADEPSMADKADSLDFEGFHKQQKDDSQPLINLGGGLFGNKPVKGTNVFNDELDNPSGKASVQEEDIGTPPSATVPRHASAYLNSPGVPPTTGEVMNIRVRYTLTQSKKTPFLAHTAAHALHSYIVDHCPHGWVKLAEWSLPVEQDYFLYYQFQCVEG